MVVKKICRRDFTNDPRLQKRHFSLRTKEFKMRQMVSPFVIVIFGATGDLAKNKLIPVLFSLYQKKQLPEKFYIVGFARREFSNADYIHWLGDETEAHHDPAWQDFTKHLFY